MESLSKATAVILAGGLGTRLRTMVKDRPKVMADIKGRPFLAYLLDMIASCGISNVVMCTGYLAEIIQGEFGRQYRSLKVAYSQEPDPLGTGGALRLALPLIKSETILVMNGDSYCWADLNDFWEWHCKRRADATILLTAVSNTERYGRVETEERSRRVLRFDEKDNHAGPGWINAGIYLIRRHLIHKIPPNRKISLEREVFPEWVSKELYGYRSSCKFIDIGTPEDYKNSEVFFN